MHVGKRKLVLTLVLHVLRVLLAEEVMHRPFLTPSAILFWSHQDGGVQISVTNLRADIIHIGGVVVLHCLADIIGAFQVDGGRVEIGNQHRGCLLDAPACCQRISLLRLRIHAREKESYQYPDAKSHKDYLICLRASFTTVSTGASGCSCKMAITTF